MLRILGWMLWVLAAYSVAALVGYMRADARKGVPIHMLQVFQAALMVCCAAAFLLPTWNKLHLVWAMPVSFIGGFLGFVLFPMPVLGTILRVATLAFARVFFLGTGADIRGVPGGR